jgi:membrane associated rhomboid family serine protease
MRLKGPLHGLVEVVKYVWKRSQGSLSLRVVQMCILIYVAVAVGDLFNIWTKNLVFSYFGLSYPGAIRHHFYYQFMTAPFLHGNLWHLLFNMLSLWMLGPRLEQKVGKLSYILLSLIAGLSGMVAALVFTWGAGTITIGCSGVIFGILVGQALYFPDDRIFTACCPNA